MFFSSSKARLNFFGFSGGEDENSINQVKVKKKTEQHRKVAIKIEVTC